MYLHMCVYHFPLAMNHFFFQRLNLAGISASPVKCTCDKATQEASNRDIYWMLWVGEGRRGVTLMKSDTIVWVAERLVEHLGSQHLGRDGWLGNLMLREHIRNFLCHTLSPQSFTGVFMIFLRTRYNWFVLVASKYIFWQSEMLQSWKPAGRRECGNKLTLFRVFQ